MAHRELGLCVWDWDATWNDDTAFSRLLAQLAGWGFDYLELGVSWRGSRSALDRRIAEVERSGLRVHLRVNLQDLPDSVAATAEWSRFADGSVLETGYGSTRQPLPSLFDPRVLDAQRDYLAGLAGTYRGRGFFYTFGFGLHFEYKYGGWIGLELVAVDRFALWLAERGFGGEARSIAEAHHPDWLEFREEWLAAKVDGFAAVVREADPSARLSAPLGESFRPESAEFGNQDIFGLSRHADRVVFSFDYDSHRVDDAPRAVEELTDVYRELTERPVLVELDGPTGRFFTGYGGSGVLATAEAAFRGGASGLNVANYTQRTEWSGDLAQFEFFPRLRELADSVEAPPSPLHEERFLLSNWTYYLDTRPGVLAAQLAERDRLRSSGAPTRLISDGAVGGAPVGTVIHVPGGTRLRTEGRG